MQDDEAVREFLIESNENLAKLDRELVELEQHPGDTQLVASIFRTIHTIKGTSGFFGFSILGSITHIAENILSQIRDKQRELTPALVSLILETVDAVKTILTAIESSGSEGQDIYQDLRQRLEQAHKAAAKSAAPAATVAATASPTPTATSAPTPAPTPTPPAQTAKPEPAKENIAAPQPAPLPAQAAAAAATPSTPISAPPAAEAAPKEQEPAATRSSAISESSIRVDVVLLDKLMNLVGELVLARNQILQAAGDQDSTFNTKTQRLNLITTELQESVMKTRMQPIGNIWSKFPRTVRDVALGCGKQVRIEMEGEGTELDKTIIEAIKDPLTHLVRNAVDHGIERPEARKTAGKNPEGRLLLRAFHEGGQVNIEITDDGAGLNFEKIRSKAIQKALVSADQVARMSEREIANLIFLPGFSTAEKVTSVSGRGVGMDVVKTNIEKIGGTVDVQSKAGQGSTVRMKIPLTLAIIPALVVTTAGDRYAIPQVNLLELVHLEGEHARKGIEVVNGARVHRLRGRLLPLVYLKRELRGGGKTQTGGLTQAASVASGALPDFAQVREKHLEWLDRLHQVLEDKATMTVEQAGSPKKCALGKWLYSAGLTEYGDIAEMHTLEESHRQFHERVRGIVRLKTLGERAQAAHELKELKPFSEHIVGLITAVEQKVLETQNVNIVVLRADDRQFGLVVDEVNDTEEIVVKPLSKQLKSINTYAGSTIMGDGKVALILDVLGLAQRAGVIGEVRDRAVAEQVEKLKKGATDKRTFLIFAGPNESRMAVPLDRVARLEELPVEQVEQAGAQWGLH